MTPDPLLTKPSFCLSVEELDCCYEQLVLEKEDEYVEGAIFYAVAPRVNPS